jgi:hypothetical protein
MKTASWLQSAPNKPFSYSRRLVPSIRRVLLTADLPWQAKCGSCFINMTKCTRKSRRLETINSTKMPRRISPHEGLRQPPPPHRQAPKQTRQRDCRGRWE